MLIVTCTFVIVVRLLLPVPSVALCPVCKFAFFFNDAAAPDIYTLSLHDALPISGDGPDPTASGQRAVRTDHPRRSEEHTSELQSRPHLVCRLLLEKKKKRPSAASPTPGPARLLVL